MPAVVGNLPRCLGQQLGGLVGLLQASAEVPGLERRDGCAQETLSLPELALYLCALGGRDVCLQCLLLELCSPWVQHCLDELDGLVVSQCVCQLVDVGSDLLEVAGRVSQEAGDCRGLCLGRAGCDRT